MTIERSHVIDLLLEARPSFEVTWQQTEQENVDEGERSLYLDAGD